MRSLLLFALGSLSLAVSSASANDSVHVANASQTAKLVPQECGTGKCAVEWLGALLEVQAPDEFATSGLFVMVKGRFKRDEWGLTNQGEAIRIDPKTYEFSVRVPVNSDVTRGLFFAVGPVGEMEEVPFIILFEGYQAFVDAREEKWLATPRTVVSGTVGVTSQSYFETGIERFEQNALTTKLTIQGPFPSRSLGENWRFGASGFATLMPFTSSRPKTEMKVFGANARVGYRIGGLPEGWNAALFGGVYFTTMSVQVPAGAAQFGVQNLSGPQIFPTISRAVGSRSLVSAYAKFAPVSAASLSLSFPVKEIAFGLSYSRAFSGISLLLAVDYAHLYGTVSGAEINSDSTSFGIGLGW